MPEYISREALLTHAIALNNPHELGENVVPVSDIEDAPAADVETVVHGRWIAEQKNAEYCEFRCSECDGSVGQTDQFDETEVKEFSEWYKYCPNCGARMDKEDET